MSNIGWASWALPNTVTANEWRLIGFPSKRWIDNLHIVNQVLATPKNIGDSSKKNSGEPSINMIDRLTADATIPRFACPIHECPPDLAEKNMTQTISSQAHPGCFCYPRVFISYDTNHTFNKNGQEPILCLRRTRRTQRLCKLLSIEPIQVDSSGQSMKIYKAEQRSL